MLPQSPPSAAPAPAPPMGGDATQAPAVQMMPVLAMLAQQQTGAIQQQQQQDQALKEAMRQQILKLVSMIPTLNPAGQAAVVTPMPPSMGPQDAQGQMSGNVQQDNTSGAPSGALPPIGG